MRTRFLFKFNRNNFSTFLFILHPTFRMSRWKIILARVRFHLPKGMLVKTKTGCRRRYIIQNDLRVKEKKKALITFISFDLFWIRLSSSPAAFQKLVSNFQSKRGIPFFLTSLLWNLKFGSTQNYPSNTFSKKFLFVSHFSLWNVTRRWNCVWSKLEFRFTYQSRVSGLPKMFGLLKK